MKTVLLVLAVVWGGSLVAIVCGIVCMWLFGRASKPPTPVEHAEPQRSEGLIVFRKRRHRGRVGDRPISGADRSA